MPLKYGKIEFGIAEMVGGLPQKLQEVREKH